ncbi:MAG: hypothetical protein ACXABY_34955 [Candidatus Thorarchaeota archaeon]
MKRVFIAGLYSKKPSGEPADIMDVLQNIRKGITTATTLLSYGFAPYCPWLDYQYFLMDPYLTVGHVHETDLAWLRVSDAVLLKDPIEDIPENSQVHNELHLAKLLEIPIFYHLEDLLKYFEEQEYV